MTYRELRKNWREYAILRDREKKDGIENQNEPELFKLNDIFSLCKGYHGDGLLFICLPKKRNESPTIAILKSDRNDVCYLFIFDQDFSGNGRWERIGKFVKINSAP